ncbi:5-formyltetrahydrofolate cyclo-ligase [Haladaptatus litoreus]|uniref:5-formyltetrahydrofolate cyclo-ligase n=1 Tax=Haladaptatus litoreus TaxID=553468 RepID=A0A1N6ZM04_9EURY|nr:5-formyltetrahydrofolate cyclo-ligase [Haladaptatus litoreus]SIR27869.1 5-formyltetrahydrofolate cyclo-ligase [Haladaptatus litoreus]
MTKDDLRERIWTRLEDEGVARFPFPPHGRIPNFAGAKEAAERLAGLPGWNKANVIKANPDSPQLPVRRRALREGKVVYMAQPRLRDEKPFMKLDPAEIEDTDAAATVSKMDDYAEPVAPDEMASVDFVVSGSVAVTDDGARVGKGEGYSDLEYAVLHEMGLVDEQTTIASTVHEMQVVEDDIRLEPYDVPMDVLVTPDREIRTKTPFSRPSGIDWEELPVAKIEEIPLLGRLQP